MDADELLRIAAQAEFDDQTTFADQIWTVNDDGTIRIEASPGTEPTVLHLNDQEEEDQDGEEEEASIPQCAGSSTSFSEPLVIVGPDQASTDLLISAEAQASEADNRPSGSHVQSAVQADAASTLSYRPSHAFVHHPYARPVYRTRATVSSVRTEQEVGVARVITFLPIAEKERHIIDEVESVNDVESMTSGSEKDVELPAHCKE
ncbi:hypothetical protein PRIPAC_92806 [Pristionchus pacificus]|uniref:Uncharacterized protein n=1 Tax=Pristionchus pacificus TaxID=54126 RepID=A0A454Y2Q8_PRIPA|nr:hypothetical protein PRIPAC_92806 [Pristionchus pacificus]|eukprot:PDM76401.1 hypothetical protein PRIPAC_40005 [Pristionchus pacificus]